MMIANDTGGLFGMPYGTTLILLIVLLVLLIGVTLALSKVRGKVKDLQANAEGAESHHESRSWFIRAVDNFNARANKTIVVLLLLGLITFLCTLSFYHTAQDLGAQIGYSPEQPIRFNHKLHAGQYGIQCEYCHTGVTKGKNATVPSLTTCMNCHNQVKTGPQYGPNEIKKIYEAMGGFDTDTRKYTNLNDAHPVKWIRVHNLPDHVYFNHSQHVVAGKLACENCHGNVKEMERVYQAATLEMGWCINCHRETNVDTSNAYYASYDFIKNHEKFKGKDLKGFTIGQLGGLECAKCHY